MMCGTKSEQSTETENLEWESFALKQTKKCIRKASKEYHAVAVMYTLVM